MEIGRGHRLASWLSRSSAERGKFSTSTTRSRSILSNAARPAGRSPEELAAKKLAVPRSGMTIPPAERWRRLSTKTKSDQVRSRDVKRRRAGGGGTIKG